MTDLIEENAIEESSEISIGMNMSNVNLESKKEMIAINSSKNLPPLQSQKSLQNNNAISLKTNNIKYRVIEVSSQYSQNNSFELLKGNNSKGWISSRFCSFPQEILLQFITPIILNQINILSHENKISSRIDFYSGVQNQKLEPLGFINFSENERSGWKARELRKVYINSPCLYLKISLGNNHINRLNIFNQVGLISIECFGQVIDIKSSFNVISNNNKDVKKSSDISESELDEVSKEKFKFYLAKKEEVLKLEDYDEAKNIQKYINKIKEFGKHIHDLEKQKEVFLANEDYESCKLLKSDLEKLRNLVKNVENNLNVNITQQNSQREVQKYSNLPSNYNTQYNSNNNFNYNSNSNFNTIKESDEIKENIGSNHGEEEYAKSVNVRDNAFDNVKTNNNFKSTEGGFNPYQSARDSNQVTQMGKSKFINEDINDRVNF